MLAFFKDRVDFFLSFLKLRYLIVTFSFTILIILLLVSSILKGSLFTSEFINSRQCQAHALGVTLEPCYSVTHTGALRFRFKMNAKIKCTGWEVRSSYRSEANYEFNILIAFYYFIFPHSIVEFIVRFERQTWASWAYKGMYIREFSWFVVLDVMGQDDTPPKNDQGCR